MSNLTFDERAVAFIDVLGFSALTETAATDEGAFVRLKDLVALLDSSIPTLDSGVNKTVPPALIPQHIYISDCIILSAPISVTLPGWNHYDGLGIVVMRTIQLTHMLLDAGYLVRGGISIGKVWHTDSNVVGPAYMEAYRLEKEGNEPRVVLSESAKALWNHRRGGWSRMCIDYQGAFMVNGLFDYYIPGSDPARVKPTFEGYASSVDRMCQSNLSDRVLQKWRWFQQYIEDELKSLPWLITS